MSAIPDRKQCAEFIVEPMAMREFRNEVAARIRTSGSPSAVQRIMDARDSDQEFALLERTLLHNDEDRDVWHIVFISPSGVLECRHISERTAAFTAKSKRRHLLTRKGEEDTLQCRQIELEAITCEFLAGVVKEGREMRKKSGGRVLTFTPGGE